jgi:hypothetical protein
MQRSICDTHKMIASIPRRFVRCQALFRHYLIQLLVTLQEKHYYSCFTNKKIRVPKKPNILAKISQLETNGARTQIKALLVSIQCLFSQSNISHTHRKLTNLQRMSSLPGYRQKAETLPGISTERI